MSKNYKYFIDAGENDSGKCLVLADYWDDSLIEIMQNQSITNLRLSRMAGWKDNDISFVTRIPLLRGIEIYANDIKEIVEITKLSLLEYVGIDCNFINDLDFFLFTYLKILKLRWRPKVKGVFSISTLELANIIGYPFTDLTTLSALKKLKRLQIESRVLNSLKGIEFLDKLEIIDLYKCPSLSDIDSLLHANSLRTIEIVKCKKVKDIGVLRDLKALERLVLEDCGNIYSLKPITDCNSLSFIDVSGDTVIEDGELREILKLPNLKKFGLKIIRTIMYQVRKYRKFLVCRVAIRRIWL